MEKEIQLTETNYCYGTDTTGVYHVGNFKIHLFSSLEGFITEETCFKLSKVETTRILLPKPFYQNGIYAGCMTEWKDSDWIYAFYNDGIILRSNLLAMREDLDLLTQLGYDIGEMPFYCSHFENGQLSFDGTLKIQKSSLPAEDLARKNDITYQEYLRNLVYNGMSEFESESNAVVEYLYSQGESTEKKLVKALNGRRNAGYLIHDDIVRSRNK